MTDKPHPGTIDVGGLPHLKDAKGRMVPVAAIKPVDLLMDQLTRELIEEARAVYALVSDFKARTFERVAEFRALVAQDFDAKVGGDKGNVQLLTFDGRQRVQVAVSDLIEFGPELEVAKGLIDEYLTELVTDSSVELRALVSQIFSVEKKGQINRSDLIMLTRMNVPDPRWIKAVAAIHEATRIVGSRVYARYYERPVPTARWNAINADSASG